MIPCKGIYGDVERDIEVMKVEEMRKFDELVEKYENYKRGYVKDINYPKQIEGKTLTVKMYIS